MHKNMYFESIFVPIQSIDEGKRIFFKDLFDAPICVFRAFLKISFINTLKMIYALCFRVFINNGMRWET